MKRLRQLMWVVAMMGLTSAPALAQERQRPAGRGGAGSAFLLMQKSVQEDLKLSDEQVKKVGEWSEKQRGSFQGLRDLSREDRQKKMAEQRQANDKAMADILKPEQVKRLKQISLQQRGGQALGDAETASALNLTDEQKEKVKTIQDKAREETRGRRGGQRDEEARKKREEARKSTNEKLMSLLTAEQKTKWKELTGEPFKGEIRRPQFGGRNRN